jgi:transcription elongation factor GreA-like protein/transcription elongation GreA/GreB family factor
MGYLDSFKEKILQEDYPGFLKIWEEYCYSENPDAKELIKILKQAKNSSIAKPFGQHVQRALFLWEKINDISLKDEVLKLIVDIQTSNNDELADIVYKYLKDKYPDDKNFDDKIRLVGLRNRENFQGAISGYELLNHVKKGNFVFHTGGWGVGEIIDYSDIREEITLEFDLVSGQKHITFDNAMKMLIPLSNDHFLARRFGNPDLLEKEAKEDPVEVIKLLLKDLGPTTAAVMKDELYELVIAPDDWNKWWQMARSKLKKDTMVQLPQDNDDLYLLREEELSHEDNLFKTLDAKPSIEEFIKVVHVFVKDFSENLKNKQFKDDVVARILQMLADKLEDKDKLQLEFLLEDLGDKSHEQSIKETIKSCKSIEELIGSMDITSMKKRVLTLVVEIKEDWQAIFHDIFFSADNNILRDYIFDAWVKKLSKKELEGKIKLLLSQPLSYPQAFIWYFKKLMQHKDDVVLGGVKERFRFLEGFLLLIDHLEKKDTTKDMAKKMVDQLVGDRFKVIRELFGEASLEEVREFLLLSSKCFSFSSSDQKIIRSIAENKFPEFREKSSATNDDFIWTTEHGYKEIQKRLQDISTVEILQNAKEIEEARGHGDLRENAEYKAALERRDRLQEEMKRLSTQLAKACILCPKDVNIEKAGVGTIISCSNTKGEHLTLTILGPWDANPEKNILSYNAKVAKEISSKAIGEKIHFKNEEFTINAIKSYFE